MICEERYEEDEEHSEEDEENRQRKCGWEKFVQVKSESEIDTLFIGKVTEGKIGMTLQMKANV